MGKRFEKDRGMNHFIPTRDKPVEEFIIGVKEDSTYVACHCNWHVRTKTCQKYMSEAKRKNKVVDPNDEKEVKTLLEPSRFILPDTHLDQYGNIVYARNPGYLNKFNPVLSSAIHCNNVVSLGW